MPRTPFIENIQTKKAERPAIIVQEELRRIYVSFFLKFVLHHLEFLKKINDL